MTAVKSSAVTTPDAGPARGRRRFRAGIVGSVVAAASLAGTASAVVAPAADASTPPVTYSYAYDSCTSITDGSTVTDTIDLSRPITAANYTGTTELFWTADLQYSANGTWHDLGRANAAFAHIWGHRGTSLTPIYWGNTANNYGVSFTVTDGYTYRVVGQTAWWNGSAWFTSNTQVVVICNF